MLQVQGLRKAYGDKILFDGAGFTMTPGERLGLVGRNGSGKTTFLKLLIGEETQDEGELILPRQYSLGHLSQHITITGETILEEASRSLKVQEGNWVETHLAEATLMGLGFATSDFERSPHELSGGYQVRLQLAKVLLEQPNLLLLDEPTNYLDIVSVRWLERFLRQWPTELILITHDQDFMNLVTTHTLAIHRGKMRRVAGPTTKLYDMIAKDEEIHEKTRLNEAKARRQTERFIERFRAKASKARQVQSRVKLLEKKGQLDELRDESTLEFSFRSEPIAGNSLLDAEGLSFGYLESEPLLEGVDLTIARGDRVAVIGKNGKGKSTLLNLLAGELTPWAGELKSHPKLKLAHFGQNNIDRLQKRQTVEDEILSVHPEHDRGAARSICGLMMFEGDDALKKVDVLSGGERARVLLGKLLVSPANLLLLDEPTNHLDMESIDSLIEAAGAFPGGVLIVTHNERVLHALANRLVIFDRERVRVFEGTYRNFLDQVGWSDEDDGRTRDDRGTGRRKKEDRRRRAEIVATRSRELAPLRKKMEKLEHDIVTREQRLEEVNALLTQASTDRDADAIARLSREHGELQDKINELFEQLEQVSLSHDEKEQEFERRLEE